MKWPRLVSVALLAIAFSDVPASAVCVSGVPLCQVFWGFEAVFEGTVVSIEQKAADDPNSPLTDIPERFRPPYRIVRFDVQRSWRGPQGSSVSLIVPGGPDVWVEDSVDYAPSGRYLVFASRIAKTDSLTTSACAPGSSIRRTDVSEEMSFLQSLTQTASGGRVFGGVYDEATFVPGQRRQPSVETRLTLAGNGMTRVQMSTKGRFSFDDLPPGTYTLTIDVPPAFQRRDPATVTISDAHACVDRSYVLHRTGG